MTEKNKVYASFSKASRFDDIDKKSRSNSPGPNTYNKEITHFDSTHRVMPKVSFTK